MPSSAKPHSEQPRPRLAFIGHSYHRATKSSQFFIDLLKARYDIDFFWDETWNRQARIDFSKTDGKVYDVAILFQVMYPVYHLRGLNCRSLVLVPMYDEVHLTARSDFYWKQYRGARFLCFSKALHEKFSKLGLDSKYFQFFPLPAATPKENKTNGLKAIFWHRTDELGWETVKQLILPGVFKKIYIHSTPDPPFAGGIEIPRGDMEKYNISISSWFEKKEDFLALLQECDVFFAPRFYEGIGLSFLEAMAMGKCVVAPDNPTMNEYMKDGVNGILYDALNPRLCSFNHCDEIGKNAGAGIVQGNALWEEGRESLYNFLTKAVPFEGRASRSFFYTSVDRLRRLLRVLK